MEKHTQNVIFLEGRKTILRPLNKETDIPFITRWINDPEVRRFVSNYLPQSVSMEEKWIDSRMNNMTSDIVFALEALVAPGTFRFIGTMGIHDIHWKDRLVTTGALIGEKEFWGKGFGTDAKMTLLEYIFNTLHMHKVCSDLISYNTRSLHYSLHCGYKIEGRRKRHFFQEGRYYDVIELGLFKKDWLPVWKKYKETGSVK